jgi:predicted NBD/HSP70 family sugar kinase
MVTSSGAEVQGRGISGNNDRRVLREIRAAGRVSQSGLGEKTGLNASTVYRIVSSLEQDGWIRESTPPAEAYQYRMGRPPTFYEARPDAAYAVGVDVWSQSMSVVLLDLAGNLLEQVIRAVDPEDGASNLTDVLTTSIDAMLKNRRVTRDRLLGIGVGAPGVVDIEKGVVVLYGRITGMSNFNIRARLANHFRVPVQVHNTVSVTAWAAYSSRQEPEGSSAFAVLIRSGVGGAYIRNGEIFTSGSRTTVEVGHMSVDMTDASSGREGVGVVEDYLCEGALVKRVSAACGPMSIEDIASAMEERREDVLGALEPATVVLAQLVRNVSHLLNPEEVFIISRFRELSEFLADEVRARVKDDDGTPRISIERVIPYEYDPIATCRGAAELVVASFLSTRS